MMGMAVRAAWRRAWDHQEEGLSHDTEVDTNPKDSRLTIAYQGVGV